MTQKSGIDSKTDVHQETERTKSFLEQVANNAYIRLYINISTGTLELNCPAANVEKEGKEVFEMGMQYLAEYDTHCAPKEPPTEPMPDDSGVYA